MVKQEWIVIGLTWTLLSPFAAIGQPGKSRLAKGGPDEDHPPREVMEAFHETAEKGEIMFELMMLHRKAGRLDKALETGQAILALPLTMDPKIPHSGSLAAKRMMIYGELAEIQLEKGDAAAATATIEDGLKKIESTPDLPAHHRKQVKVQLLKRAGRIYQIQGNSDKAIEHLEKALAVLK